MSKDYFVIDFLRFTGYAESLKTCTKRFSHPLNYAIFLYLPYWRMRTENILNIGQSFLCTAFSESATSQICVAFLKRYKEMKKSIEELQTENELLRATLALVMEKLKELTELLNGGRHE